MHIDNEGIQKALEKGFSAKEEIMQLVRAVYFYTGIYNITYKTLHISTHLNGAADALSRQNVELFHSQYLASEKEMTKPVDFICDF